jgi:uncharacterized protein YqeY
MLDIDILMREAMRAQQTTILSVLRGIKTATATLLSAKGRGDKPLTEDEQITILRKQLAQREDSIKCFHEAGRLELAQAEEREKAILEAFLPAELDAYAVDALVEQALADTGAVTKKDMGKTIARAKELAAGRVDPRVLSQLISAKLA